MLRREQPGHHCSSHTQGWELIFLIAQSVVAQFFGTTDPWENGRPESLQLAAASRARLDATDPHVLDPKPLALNLVILP
jgi:hypothetical protein